MLAVPVRPLPRLVARPVPALPVAALVVGRPVGEVEALLPRLFNLCSGAQKAAFSAALGGHASVAESRADVLRDHLLKFHATWPSLLGIAPQTLPTKWKQGGLSLLSWLFGPSAAPPATPDIVYITTFAPDRTDEEIIASNIANQERKEARQRLEEARIEKRREMYRALGQATGIDTDKMEAEIAEERAREEAAIEARIEEATGGSVDDSDAE